MKSLFALVISLAMFSVSANEVSFQHIRSATAKVTYGDTTFLIDPMLAKEGTYDGFSGFHNDHLRNPLTELPLNIDEVIATVDAVIVTHTHSDHWDRVAQEVLPKSMPIFVQNANDAERITKQGFTDVRVLTDGQAFQGVRLHKTGGQHGTDLLYAIPALARGLGEVMGVVFSAPNAPTLYVAGDTTWRPEVEQAITTHNPDVIVLNTGAGKLKAFPDNPILMSKEDTLVAAQLAPDAKIVAVHMDALHHMTVSRAQLREYLVENKLGERVHVPEDGDTLTFTKPEELEAH